MNRNQLQDLLTSFQTGKISLEHTLNRLKDLPFEDLGFAKLDHHRHLRKGFPEVIYGEGKTPEHLQGIALKLKARGQPVLITRCGPEAFQYVAGSFPELVYHEMARCATWHPDPKTQGGTILIVSAGTTDLHVAEEAAVTAEIMGNPVERIYDIGVAGLHRLLAHKIQMESANVIVAVAGMEGALPSVISGLVDVPVIGVPTSVGYGTSFGGVTALLSMLNSCASGITVVNIDNGFGAGYAATLMNRSRQCPPASPETGPESE